MFFCPKFPVSVLDYFVKYQNDKYIICNRVAYMGYRELKSTAVAINNSNLKGTSSIKTQSSFWENSTCLLDDYDGSHQCLKSIGIEEI